MEYLPEKYLTDEGEARRVGVEIELTGVSPEDILSVMQKQFLGEKVRATRFEYFLRNSRVGEFRLELDAELLKSMAQTETEKDWEEDSVEALSVDLIAQASEWLVPWEIVSPPLAFTELVNVHHLIERLRDCGAQGTRHSVLHAFGVHLNLELPNTQVSTILRYFRAYLCLYDWIASQERVDLSRKLTTYIKHFNKDYLDRILDWHYRPTSKELIDDYLDYNPTRNRSLDLLPLFTFVDEKRVKSVVKDPRVKARPTLHYRLPNCDIDNPDWNIDVPWRSWLCVEALANEELLLEQMCADYRAEIQRFTHPIEGRWLKRINECLPKIGLKNG